MKKGSKMTLEQIEKVRIGHLGQVAWNKGLTKEMDIRVKSISNRVKIANAEGRCGTKGMKYSEETKRKIGLSNSIALKETWKNFEYRKMMSDKHKEFYRLHPEKHPNRIQRRNRMTYIEIQIQNVLIDNLKLINNVDFEHNYRIKNYFVDFAIFNNKLVIECDGEYWHLDKERDLFRQREIENEGWKVIRFTGEKIRNNLEECKNVIYAEHQL